jgi:AcrR family transcriptional regulator
MRAMRDTAVAGKPRRLPASERFEQLLDVAEDLFMAQGYDRTSIEDIARAAGVTRPIVYQHHGSKEGVYLGCVARARRALVEEYATAIGGLSEPREVLRAAAGAWFSIVERDPTRWALLFGGSAIPMTGDLGRRLTEERSKNLGYYIQAVQSWTRPDVPADHVAALAHLISGIGDQLARWWLTNRHVSREQIVDYYCDFCWNGLTPLMSTDHA